VRVSLETTGVYSLDLSMALNAAARIEVAVLNPKAANRFAQTIRRSKTDAAGAEVLAEYSRRMPFTAWRAPNPNGLRLRMRVGRPQWARSRARSFRHLALRPANECLL
jgi:transposase